MTGNPVIARRGLLTALTAVPLVAACTAPLLTPRSAASTPEAAALLGASAAAHGAAALAGVRDISVRYSGQWRGLVGTLQPALTDEGFRGRSEERLLLRDGLAAQSYDGPDGHKAVVRQSGRGERGSVRVWYDGVAAQPGEKTDAAALVADGYGLFLLGPMLLAGPWASQRSLVLEVGTPEPIVVAGQGYVCDVLRARVTPGVGLSEGDTLALFIDRGERLMRRVRFTLDGLDSTRNAVAEVDCWAHVGLAGCRWPTRFHEQLLRPLPLPVHDWRLEGLDLDRGMTRADLSGPALGGVAARPAAALPA